MFDFGGCFDTDFHFALCAVNFALLQFHTLHFICSPKHTLSEVVFRCD